METTTLNNHEEIQDFINLHEVNYPIEYVINDKINSILFTETNALTLQSKELFNEYAKVFESIE